MFRTDSHNNPTAFTVDVAREAGLVLGTDYLQGDPFQVGELTYYTARLLGDPLAITKRVISALGYRTRGGIQRWTYISLPNFVWKGLTDDEQTDVIGFHYMMEGGTEMRGLFSRFGQH